jgi:thiamine transport system substrate-binding protein
VVVVDSWETAYFTNFSGSAGKGPQPIVVSYATSPAYEVVASEGKLSEPPTGNIMPPKGAFRQIEFAGILKGTKNLELAKKWMDYMLSRRVQDDIMPQMVVYPVLPDAVIPEVYQEFAPLPAQPAALDPATIAQNRDTWIQQWTRTVLR